LINISYKDRLYNIAQITLAKRNGEFEKKEKSEQNVCNLMMDYTFLELKCLLLNCEFKAAIHPVKGPEDKEGQDEFHRLAQKDFDAKMEDLYKVYQRQEIIDALEHSKNIKEQKAVLEEAIKKGDEASVELININAKELEEELCKAESSSSSNKKKKSSDQSKKDVAKMTQEKPDKERTKENVKITQTIKVNDTAQIRMQFMKTLGITEKQIVAAKPEFDRILKQAEISLEEFKVKPGIDKTFKEYVMKINKYTPHYLKLCDSNIIYKDALTFNSDEAYYLCCVCWAKMTVEAGTKYDLSGVTLFKDLQFKIWGLIKLCNKYSLTMPKFDKLQ
jgi:hypothetical protein